jgi:hypothetical protein
MSDALKQLVIKTAREQAEAGAHYLWGAAGNTPGQSDGASYRPAHAKLHANVPDVLGAGGTPAYKVNAPVLFAAYVNSSDQGDLPCAGRPVTFTNELGLKLELKKGAGGAFDLKLKDLTDEQKEELKTKASTPDSYRWPRPNDLILNNNQHFSTVWGESCLKKRHFDCIGFVNWCFSTALQKLVHYGIENFTDTTKTKYIGKEIPVKSAQLGDIVTIGAVHIGIVSDRGTAIEAKDKLYGVVEHPLEASKWTQCFRLHNTIWNLGK